MAAPCLNHMSTKFNSSILQCTLLSSIDCKVLIFIVDENVWSLDVARHQTARNSASFSSWLIFTPNSSILFVHVPKHFRWRQFFDRKVGLLGSFLRPMPQVNFNVFRVLASVLLAIFCVGSYKDTFAKYSRCGNTTSPIVYNSDVVTIFIDTDGNISNIFLSTHISKTFE